MNVLPSCEDYISSIEVPQLIKAKELYGGKVVSYNGNPVMYSGGFCVVFQYQLPSMKKVAVRCWTAHVPDADKRSNRISIELKRSGLPYFVEFTYVPQGIATTKGILPIVIMDWVEASSIKEFINSHIHEPRRIFDLAERFKLMVSDLHKVSFSHGDLQHGNIMVADDGKLILVDYDSMYVPGLENFNDDIKGLAGYQHPSRSQQKYLSPKSDYFSELIIYTSLIALSKYPELWKQLNILDTETLLFTREDLDAPYDADIFNSFKRDADLKPLVEAIERELRSSDLDNLLPLEEAIIPESTRIIGNLEGKWRKRSLPSEKESQVDLANLSKKWKNKTIVPKTENINVTSITSKW